MVFKNPEAAPEQIEIGSEDKAGKTVEAKAVKAEVVDSDIKLRDLLEQRSAEFAGYIEETTRLEDTDIFQTPEEQAAFAALATKLGIPNYDINTGKTFELVVASTGSKFLKGPQLHRYGVEKQICLNWEYMIKDDGKEYKREHVLPLPVDADANGKEYRLRAPSGDLTYCEVIYDVPGLRFPLPLRIDTSIWKSGQELNDAMLNVSNLGDLATYLVDGSPIVQWRDLPDGAEVTLELATKLERGDGSEFALCQGKDADGNPCRVYLNDIQVTYPQTLPATASKKDDSTLVITSLGGKVDPFEVRLSQSISKLLELEVGKVHFISATELLKGDERTSVVLTLDNESHSLGKFWANGKMTDRILKLDNPETQGFLIVDKHATTRQGKAFPVCRFWLLEDLANPVVAKLMKRQGLVIPNALMAKAVEFLPDGAKTALTAA